MLHSQGESWNELSAKHKGLREERHVQCEPFQNVSLPLEKIKGVTAGAAGVCKRLRVQYLQGVPRCSSVNVSLLFFFFSIAVQETGRRGLVWAGLLLSLELSLSVRVSFVQAVGDKPPDAGM